MCGAVAIKYDPAMKEELTKFFTAEEIARFETNGEIVFAYWDKQSLLEKKWDHLKPKVVLIPVQRGCEKKVWFDLTADIKAVLVQKDGIERVYMITEAATPEYQAMTKHERMPRLVEIEIKKREDND